MTWTSGRRRGGRHAREEAGKLNAVPIALMNGEQLVVRLLVENEIKAKRQKYDLIEIGKASAEIEG